MGRYDRLLEYIDYFEDGNRNFCTWKTPGDRIEDTKVEAYPDYDEKFKSFIDEVHKAGILRHDFREFLETRIPAGTEVIDAVEDGDLETCASILAYFIEIEEYMSGIWEECAQDGTFLKILKRMKQLN